MFNKRLLKINTNATPLGSIPIPQSATPDEQTPATHGEDVDMLSELTPISTPTDQSTYFNQAEYFKPRYSRTESVSSIASSVSNFPMANELNLASFASNYKLTSEFESLLMEVYCSYQTNPQITPFNESSPPSGLITLVTKDTLQQALEKNIDIGIDVNNYTLTIIRQKFIQLCHKAYGFDTRSRNNSCGSMVSIPNVNLMSKFTNTPPSASSSSSQTDTLSTSNDSNLFSFELPNTPPATANSSTSNGGLQPSVRIHDSNIDQSVNSPVPSGDVPESLFNATSQRKRESLRLKRTGNKIVSTFR
ncbi:hypothetical protein WICPIJ_005706 [Wickerhamomyces pijperi]|uniref:Uncharacterized protein n=1 Tax=Wickerhamomyces pijperi TaxID=599730 RepID=A0A9P8Q563_WICPI|nr:hypothetical protein WICPIJ_005706 [Wickerhamomyces pijperi]